MWLKEKEFRIRLGGQIFVNVPVLIQFNGESLFTVRRHEETGEIGIDCDVYDQAGGKIASIRRNNMYPGDLATYEVERSEDRITLRDVKTRTVLAQVRKHGEALPLELDVSVRTYLPDGRLLDAGPELCTIPGLFMVGNTIENGPVGIAISVPNLVCGKEFANEEIRIDGKTFVGCRFRACTMVFSATAPFGLSGNDFDQTGWRFDGAAAATLVAMKAMYDGGFKIVIDDTIKTIRGELPKRLA
jgi:hypothetical protein